MARRGQGKNRNRLPRLRRRKWRLYVDADFPAQSVAWLQQERRKFDVLDTYKEGYSNRPDDYHLHEASSLRRILLTRNRHFWDDKKHPLANLGAVIVVEATPPNLDAKAAAIVIALWEQLSPSTSEVMRRCKIRATIDGYELKLLDATGHVATEYRSW